MASRALRRRTWVGAGLAFVVFTAIGVQAWRSARLLTSANQWVARTHQTINELDRLRSLMLRTEGATALPDQFVETCLDRAAAIETLTAGNPPQWQKAKALSAAVRAMAPEVDRREALHDAGVTVRKIVDQMVTVENDALIGRIELSQQSATGAARLLAVLTFSGGAVLAIGFFFIYRQTQREMRLERQRVDAETQMRVVIDRMPAGLITADWQGRILTVNPAAERMFGYEERELTGQSIQRLMAVTGDDAKAILREMPGAALDKVTEWPARRKDGRVFPMELSLFSFDADGGRRLAGHVRDISDRREVDRMKDEFISVVSHELRTPLTSVRGALQLVLADPPAFKDDDHAPLLGIALSSTERLIRLVNDILDISKIEAGQVQLRRIPADVRRLIRAAVDAVGPVAVEAGVRFTVECDDRVIVDADTDRMTQVLMNLLSNAVKYSPAGSTIAITVRRAASRVEIAVTDRGPGIAAEDLPRLFTRFRQLDSSATRDRGGTGLGLAISKALAEQHGGGISVASEVGRGSTFTVWLPASQADAPLAATPKGGLGQTGGRILLAEDDDDLRAVLSQTLAKRGYHVQAAPHGADAQHLYDRDGCDALVIDLHMPVSDGFALIEHVRATEAGRHLPILVVSGSNTGRGEARSLELGANVFFTKPVDPESLIAELQSRLQAISRS